MVTCCEAFTDGPLRTIQNWIGINEQGLAEPPGMKGMWSFQFVTLNIMDTFQTVSSVNENHILARLEETKMQLLLCRDAIHNQFFQQAASSIRPVSAALLDREKSPGFPIIAASLEGGSDDEIADTKAQRLRDSIDNRRQGVNSSGKYQLITFIPTIRTALYDSVSEVQS